MARPALATRIEERNDDFRCRITGGLERQFLKLTGIAAQGKVSECRRSAAAFRIDMIQA
jgi:hypothetical protein